MKTRVARRFATVLSEKHDDEDTTADCVGGDEEAEYEMNGIKLPLEEWIQRPEQKAMGLTLELVKDPAR